MAVESKESKTGSARTVLRRMKVFYVVLLLLVLAGSFAYFGYVNLTTHIRNEARLLSGMDKQAVFLVENYFQKLESAAMVTMSSGEIMDYDAADPRLDEYEHSQQRGQVADLVTRIGLIDNYCDFTLIYRNSQNAGKLSAESKELFAQSGEPIYETLSGKLGQDRMAWLFNVCGDRSRIFLVCRADEDKLLLGSFYTQELDQLFLNNEIVEDTGYALLDRDGIPFFFGGDVSSQEMADKLALEARDLQADNGSSVTLIDYSGARIIACEELGAGGTLVALRDLSSTMDVYRKDLLIMGILMAVSLAVLTVFNIFIMNGQDIFQGEIPRARDIDALTGLPNAEEAENLMADKLETSASGATVCIAVVCIANLSWIDENYGTSGHNGAVLKTSHLLAAHFGTLDRDPFDKDTRNVVARTGRDEFTVYGDFTEYDLFKAHDAVKASLAQLEEKLPSLTLSRPGDVQIAIGSAVFPDDSADYDDLYDQARKAALERAAQLREAAEAPDDTENTENTENTDAPGKEGQDDE